MRSFTAIIALCFAGFAQTRKSALDKATLEAYLRHVNLYRGTVNYKIDDPKPSKYLPGFSEVVVHLTFDSGSKDDLYYISADGQTILEGDVYKINQNPFQSNLDRLITADQPNFGPKDADEGLDLKSLGKGTGNDQRTHEWIDIRTGRKVGPANGAGRLRLRVPALSGTTFVLGRKSR